MTTLKCIFETLYKVNKAESSESSKRHLRKVGETDYVVNFEP